MRGNNFPTGKWARQADDRNGWGYTVKSAPRGKSLHGPREPSTWGCVGVQTVAALSANPITGTRLQPLDRT